MSSECLNCGIKIYAPSSEFRKLEFNLEERESGGEYYYYLTVRYGDTKSTKSYKDVPCTTSLGAIGKVDLTSLSSKILGEIYSFPKNHYFEIGPNSVQLLINDFTDTENSTCLVDVDLDSEGLIVGINVI